MFRVAYWVSNITLITVNINCLFSTASKWALVAFREYCNDSQPSIPEKITSRPLENLKLFRAA